VKREDLQRVAKQYFTDSGRYTLRFVLPEANNLLLTCPPAFSHTSLALSARSLRPLFAEVDGTKSPEPGPAPAISFPDFQDLTLPNGLRVYLIQR